jgi:hypothetical protein
VMLSDVDAVIAALRVVLHEVETHTNFSRTKAYWETHIVNKWIYQLPGARWGRWRQLRLRPDNGNLAERTNLIMHVRATLAYLETNRETIARVAGDPRCARPLIGLDDVGSWLSYIAIAEAFFARHLGGAGEPVGRDFATAPATRSVPGRTFFPRSGLGSCLRPCPSVASCIISVAVSTVPHP